MPELFWLVCRLYYRHLAIAVHKVRHGLGDAWLEMNLGSNAKLGVLTSLKPTCTCNSLRWCIYGVSGLESLDWGVRNDAVVRCCPVAVVSHLRMKRPQSDRAAYSVHGVAPLIVVSSYSHNSLQATSLTGSVV
jgi:hypothetical protein